MSSAMTPAPPQAERKEIHIYSHSTLVYWWPVWAVALICGVLSLTGGQRLVVVPQETEYLQKVNVIRNNDILADRQVLSMPKDAPFSDGALKLHASPNKNLGVFFCVTLLLVITITSVSLRGLLSVIVISVIFFMSIIFAILDWWTPILERLSFLDIRISAGGYMLLGSILFGLWLFTVFVFDRQIYMIFTPRQFRVRLEIGDAETAYDTTNIRIEKQRTDLFRHWVLGLGAGDLRVQTTGAQSHHFDMPNVLFVGNKVQQIQDLITLQVVVSQPSLPNNPN